MGYPYQFSIKTLLSNVTFLICDTILFVGVAHLTRGGRYCSWALYRWRGTLARGAGPYLSENTCANLKRPIRIFSCPEKMFD